VPGWFELVPVGALLLIVTLVAGESFNEKHVSLQARKNHPMTKILRRHGLNIQLILKVHHANDIGLL
jgi:hypothetical protein